MQQIKKNSEAAVLYAKFIIKNKLNDTTFLIVLEYLEKAIERENAEAMFLMAAFLADKDYGIFDPDKSIYYYNQSASLGFLEAQLLLASIYDDPSTAIYNPPKSL